MSAKLPCALGYHVARLLADDAFDVVQVALMHAPDDALELENVAHDDGPTAPRPKNALISAPARSEAALGR